MKSGKHTPGPWYAPTGLIDGRTDGPRIVSDDDVICAVEYIDADQDSATTERRLADARLIAAAPDMLEALDVVRGCLASIDIECLSRSDRREIEKAEAYIEDALAKARGES